MKNKRIIILCGAFAIAFCSCSLGDSDYRAPSFKVEKDIDLEILGEVLFSPSNLKVTEDYLIATGYTQTTKETFYVYNKEGEQMRSGIYCGQGPRLQNRCILC